MPGHRCLLLPKSQEYITWFPNLDSVFRPVEKQLLESLALEPLTLLEVLDLSSNKLYNAMLDEWNEKLGYSTLRGLNLSRIWLYALDAMYNFLENKWFSNLTDLVMQQSQVRKVEMKSFKNLLKLQTPYLSQKSIWIADSKNLSSNFLPEFPRPCYCSNNLYYTALESYFSAEISTVPYLGDLLTRRLRTLLNRIGQTRFFSLFCKYYSADCFNIF